MIISFEAHTTQTRKAHGSYTVGGLGPPGANVAFTPRNPMNFLKSVYNGIYTAIFKRSIEAEEIARIEASDKRLKFRNMSIASENWAQGIYPDEGYVTPFIQAAMWFQSDTPTAQEMQDVLYPLVAKFHRLRSKIFQLSTGQFYFREMDVKDIQWDSHILTFDVSSEDEIHDIIQENIKTKMSRTKPLWEIRIFRNSGEGRSCVLLCFDHALGDGLSLLKLCMGMVRNMDGSELEFTMPQMPKGPRSLFARLKKFAWNLYRMIRAHIQTLAMSGANDSTTRFKIPHFPSKEPGKIDRVVFPLNSLTISGLSIVRKAILEKTGQKATINDVLFGLLGGMMKRTMEKTKDKGLQAKLKMRSWSPFSFPHPNDLDPDDQLRNLWSMVSAEIPVNASTPLKRVLAGKREMDDLKTGHAALAASQVQSLIVSTLGYKVQGFLTLRAMSGHSFCWTNVPGFREQVTVAGHVVDDCTFVLCTPVPYVTVGSYNGHLNLIACIEPSLLSKDVASVDQGKAIMEQAWREEVVGLCEEVSADSSQVFYNPSI